MAKQNLVRLLMLVGVSKEDITGKRKAKPMKIESDSMSDTDAEARKQAIAQMAKKE